jgi:pyruvate dehydrogenase E2 component (dihydrolipoamide acetyltransferase)
MGFLSKWFSQNVELGAPLQVSRWRKISISSWKVTHDSSVVSILELDAEPARKYLERLQAQSGTTHKLTITHFAGFVLAKVFAKYPEVNCLYRLGKLYRRKTVDICFLVSSGRGGIHGSEDLSGYTLRAVDQLVVVKIAEGLTPTVKLMKSGKDTTFRGIKHYIGHFPHWARMLLVNFADFMMHVMNLWSPLLGFQRDAFGSAMLTSVGSLDIEFAIPRIYPQSRNVMMMAVGAVREKPVVKNGAVVVGKQLKIVFTADHRIVDGLHAAYLLKEFQSLFENPEGIPAV